MSKLQLNGDGTVTLPLSLDRIINLPEPTLGQISRIRRQAREADEALGTLTTVDPSVATPEQVAAFNAALLDRTDKIFDGDASPHGQALFSIIKELTGETVTADDVPAWAGSPRTIAAILTHFQAPLPGPDSVPTT